MLSKHLYNMPTSLDNFGKHSYLQHENYLDKDYWLSHYDKVTLLKELIEGLD